MAGERKMLPPNIRVDWIPTSADEPGIVDVNAPTAEELNAGENITCAITSPDYTLGWTDRDTDDTKSLCDDSNVATPIYKNYEGNLTFFRDADRENALSAYNIAYELFKTPLQPGYLVERVGKPYDEPYVDGDEVSVFYFLSGDPNTMHEDGTPVRMQVMFYAQGRSSEGIVEVGGTSS
jgi:hypothetical protein